MGVTGNAPRSTIWPSVPVPRGRRRTPSRLALTLGGHPPHEGGLGRSKASVGAPPPAAEALLWGAVPVPLAVPTSGPSRPRAHGVRACLDVRLESPRSASATPPRRGRGGGGGGL